MNPLSKSAATHASFHRNIEPNLATPRCKEKNAPKNGEMFYGRGAGDRRTAEIRKMHFTWEYPPQRPADVREFALATFAYFPAYLGIFPHSGNFHGFVLNFRDCIPNFHGVALNFHEVVLDFHDFSGISQFHSEFSRFHSGLS